MRKNNTKKDAFERIYGNEEVKKTLRYYADYLTSPEKYEKLCVKIPTGILIYGISGIGKTTMAKAFLKESKRKTFIINQRSGDGDFISKIENIAKKALTSIPSVIFFDDMDKYFAEEERNNSEKYTAIRRLMDAYSSKGVYFLATVSDKSNMPDYLMRAGYFECQLEICFPCVEESEKLMKKYLSSKPLSKDVDKELVARLMSNYTCTQMERVMNEAGLLSAFNGEEEIDKNSILYACIKEIVHHDFIMFDEIDADNEIPDCNMEKIAVHEMGHAIVANAIDPGSVNMVAILSGKYTKGHTFYRRDEKNEREFDTKWVLIHLGGIAATDIFYGQYDKYGTEDYNRVRCEIIRLFISHNINDFSRFHDIDPLVTYELENYYRRTKKILLEHKELFEILLTWLKTNRFITFRDLEYVENELAKRPLLPF